VRHGHGHGHDGQSHDGDHGHDGRSHDGDHVHGGSLAGRLADAIRHPRRLLRPYGLLHPHQHDHAASLDDAVLADRAGRRALTISFAGLLLTALAQAAAVAVSGSVGLLADMIHNAADAFTAVPIGVAFLAARRPPTRRYTYGYGRSEDLAGLAVVVVMTASAIIAAWEAAERFAHPRPVHHLAWVAVAGAIGLAGNELAARYRIRVGRQIGSAALVADGYHARADGFTSLAVVVGAAGVALGWPAADPVVGLVITAAILVVLRGAVRDIYRRLMDAVDPELTAQIEQQARSVPGVRGCDGMRVRWVGHELRAELNILVPGDLPVTAAHDTAEAVRHHLLHQISRLADAAIHINPDGTTNAHALTAHHYTHTADHTTSPRRLLRRRPEASRIPGERVR
jgi:cation diffusion facilitator family transporter